MRKILLIILFLLPIIREVFGQEGCLELNVGWQLIEDEKYSESETFFRNMLSTFQNNNKQCIAYCYFGIASSSKNSTVRIEYYQKAIELFRKPTFHYDSSFYFLALIQLANLYTTETNFSSAESLYKQALTIQKKTIGDNNPDYAGTLNLLGSFYKKMRRYEAAESTYKEALTTQANAAGENAAYAAILSNLGSLYVELEQFSKAEPLIRKALSIQKLTIGERDPSYLNSLNNLAVLYNGIGNYVSAEPLFKEALVICNELFGEEDPRYANLLNGLASVYSETDNFLAAEPLYKQAIAIYKLRLGENDPTYANSLSNLGSLYYKMGKYAEAETLFLQALSIQRSKLGENDPQFLSTKNSLASLYSERGKYREADSTYNDLNESVNQISSRKDSDDYYYFSNRGNYFIEIGDYLNAETYLKRAVSIIKIKFGDSHPEYAVATANLATLYKNLGDFDKAKPLYLEAIKVYQSNSGSKNYRAYALLLTDLAGIYTDLDMSDKALQLYEEAIQIQKNTLSPSHPERAYVDRNLAGLYTKMRKYPEAEFYYLEALKIYRGVLGENHLAYQTTLTELINLYYLSGNFSLAIKNFLTLFKIQNEFIINGTNFFSNTTLSYFLRERSVLNNFFNTLLFSRKDVPNLSRQAQYNNELFLKNFLLRNSNAVQRSINNSGDTSLINLFNGIKLLRNSVVLETTGNERPKLEIESEIQQKETKLIKLSSEYRKAKDLFSRDVEDIKKALKPNQAAIEIVGFPHNSLEYSSDNISYIALILRSNYNAPICVHLFEEIQLTDILQRKISEKDSSYFFRLYGNNRNNLLDPLIWKPLDSLLTGIQTIYYTKSGLLHTINFEALPSGMKYQLINVGTTADLIDLKEVLLENGTIQRAFILGGVDYDKTSTTKQRLINTETSQIDYNLPPEQKVRGAFGNNWPFLPGTLSEGKDVAELIKAHGISVDFIEGREASEVFIKSLSRLKVPFVLHLATHGYAFPELKDSNSMNILAPKPAIPKRLQEKLKFSEEPLLRSGLILSGANQFWNRSGVRSDSVEDGILTAYEISNLDLSHCQLVVLSACQTGLGDIRGSEGVYGLQRAFKMAGVKNIIMSLWEIPDLQTKELMELFYSNCFKGMPVARALREAQRIMSTKYSPFYWAGFVLLQ